MLSKKHDKTGALQRAMEHVLRRPSSIYTEIKGLPVQDKLLNNLHKRFLILIIFYLFSKISNSNAWRIANHTGRRTCMTGEVIGWL